MKWSIIIAICIGTFGTIPLMGVPGAIVLLIGQACAELFNLEFLCMKGDRGWPAAIITTWIWPLTIPLAYFFSFRTFKAKATGAKWAIFACLLFVGGLIVSSGVELLARQEQRTSAVQSSR